MDGCAEVRQRHRTIIAFHQDEHGDWVADLACGHTQHMRHNPPWIERPWVMTPEGRQHHLGGRLECRQCATAEGRPGERAMTDGGVDHATGEESTDRRGDDA
jgi:hypothetical protein